MAGESSRLRGVEERGPIVSGGVPGIGKTQLGIQLTINVQIPVKYGGLGGKAIYIEGSFMVERAHQIADVCVKEIAYGAAIQREHFQPSEERIDANIFLANIFYFLVSSYTEQIAVVNNLDNFIASQDNEGERVVTKKEGIEFASEYGCLFLECSAKTRVNVEQCFEELVLKILDTKPLSRMLLWCKTEYFQLETSTSGCC